jgi:hypothetical protein
MAGYINETEFEARFERNIDANSYPTTTNFETWSQQYTYILNAKLGISSNITDTTVAGVCKYIVGVWIWRAGNYCKTVKGYVSPERATTLPPINLDGENSLVETVRDNLTTEDEPAYYYNMYNYNLGGGAPL